MTGNNYRAQYHKTGGPTVTVDFNLYCSNGRWFGDEGAFSISSGQVKSYIFKVGNQGNCQVRLIQNGSVIGSTGYIKPA